jgi:hypothetical protein
MLVLRPSGQHRGHYDCTALSTAFEVSSLGKSMPSEAGSRLTTGQSGSSQFGMLEGSLADAPNAPPEGT